MSGQNNFMSKAFGVFVDVDKMVGTDFEKGLAALDTATAFAAAATVRQGAPVADPATP